MIKINWVEVHDLIESARVLVYQAECAMNNREHLDALEHLISDLDRLKEILEAPTNSLVEKIEETSEG